MLASSSRWQTILERFDFPSAPVLCVHVYNPAIFGMDIPRGLAQDIPARKPFVAVGAFPVTRRHRRHLRHRRSQCRGCARLARATFFPQRQCRVSLRTLFAFSFPIRLLAASLLRPRNDLRDRLDSSFSLVPRHNS